MPSRTDGVKFVHKFVSTYDLSGVLPCLTRDPLRTCSASEKRGRTNCSELKAKRSTSLECKFRVSRYDEGFHNLNRFLIRKRSLKQRAGKLRTSSLFRELVSKREERGSWNKRKEEKDRALVIACDKCTSLIKLLL